MSEHDITADAVIAAHTLSAEMKEIVSFNSDGLVPVIVQDYHSHRVLMMAWMDEHALAYTIATSRGTYYSRSRGQYWVKGETSGHLQQVHGLEIDCDGDTILMFITQTGAACHTGTTSCFDTHTVAVATASG